MNTSISAKNIVLVEDDPNLAANLEDMLDLYGYEVPGILDNAETAFQIIIQLRPDLILLDIQLKGEKSGIQLAEELRALTNIPIVFLTGSTGIDVVRKIKHLKPEGIITKPFTAEGLITNIELALEVFALRAIDTRISNEHKNQTEFFIRENGWLKKINIQEITWIKTEGNYTHIFKANKQHTLRNTVKEVMEKLPVEQFIRIHKSYIVNIDKIEALNSSAVKIANHEIPIGRSYYQALLTKIPKLTT